MSGALGIKILSSLSDEEAIEELCSSADSDDGARRFLDVLARSPGHFSCG